MSAPTCNYHGCSLPAGGPIVTGTDRQRWCFCSWDHAAKWTLAMATRYGRNPEECRKAALALGELVTVTAKEAGR